MKTSRLRILLLLVLLCGAVTAQNISNTANAVRPLHSRQTKAVRLHGNVSSDGARFIEDVTQKAWLITNAEMCKPYEGQQAIVRAKIAPATSTMQVLSIGPQTTYTAHWGDSAFRR